MEYTVYNFVNSDRS